MKCFWPFLQVKQEMTLAFVFRDYQIENLFFAQRI